MCNDLQPIIEGWDYRPGQTTVRKINGLDGKEKLQMRLQLGVLQMEYSGRPDGQKPYGYESLLEYFGSILEKLKGQDKQDDFELSAQDSADLRDEALQYYYRYLSLFDLGDHAGVIRDTDRNLRVFDLVKAHAKNDADRFALEQYRPYVVMMNARSRAGIALRENDLNAAYKALQDGMDLIRKFFQDYGQPNLAAKSDEYRVLDKQAAELRNVLPRDPLAVLREKLDAAVKQERFEEAVRLRDKIRKLESSSK
ncbi:MAG TPA: UvrB/UvrC motif-containing protein [Planctomycetota bacterium]|nr:UvrB/UvrC motif-containing protein [Planctomycetota bacterium]